MLDSVFGVRDADAPDGGDAATVAVLDPATSCDAERIDTRIILVDGTELARLMIAHGVGVTPVAVYELKRVDSDFFAED